MAKRLKLKKGVVSKPLSRSKFNESVKAIKAHDKAVKKQQRLEKHGIINDIRKNGVRSTFKSRVSSLPIMAKKIASAPIKGATKAITHSKPILGARYAIGGLSNLKNKTAEGIAEHGSLKAFAGKSIKDRVSSTKPVKAIKKGKNLIDNRPTSLSDAKSKAVSGLKNYAPKRVKHVAQQVGRANAGRKALGKGIKNFRTDRRNNGLKSALGTRAGNLGKRVMSSKKVTELQEKIKKGVKTIAKLKTPIIVSMAIMTFLSVTLPFTFAVAGQFGQSPHFYCDLNAPKEVKQTEMYKRYCGVPMGMDSIAMAAVTCAYREYGEKIENGEEEAWFNRGSINTDFPEYREAREKIMDEQLYSSGVDIWAVTGGLAASCDASSSTWVHVSGADLDMPFTSAGTIYDYLVKSDKWEDLGEYMNLSMDELLPGDIISAPGHIYTFVGEIAQERWPEASPYTVVEASHWGDTGGIGYWPYAHVDSPRSTDTEGNPFHVFRCVNPDNAGGN